MISGKFQKGFSLIEMIVVLVITASLGIAIYTTFSQGVRLWSRTAKDRGEWKVSFFMETMTEGLRNAFKDPRWMFRGDKTILDLATISFSEKSNGAGGDGRPVYFHYVFDSENKTINVQKNHFEDVFSPEPVKKDSMAALEKVRAFELEYYSYDERARKYRWSSKWDRGCFPEAVKITIEQEQDGYHKLSRMINMPTGSVCSA